MIQAAAHRCKVVAAMFWKTASWYAVKSAIHMVGLGPHLRTHPIQSNFKPTKKRPVTFTGRFLMYSTTAIPWQFEIPLKSGRCCKKMKIKLRYFLMSQSLWSQGGAARVIILNMNTAECLNPFEVREVLQEHAGSWRGRRKVSIPLKSGRCCKFMRGISDDVI